MKRTCKKTLLEASITPAADKRENKEARVNLLDFFLSYDYTFNMFLLIKGGANSAKMHMYIPFLHNGNRESIAGFTSSQNFQLESGSMPRTDSVQLVHLCFMFSFFCQALCVPFSGMKSAT